MKVAILGTRGIPNHYGGFEQFAEYLSLGLVELGAEVFVYNSHNHPCQEKTWKGVNIIHQFDPEYKIGTAGQFLYDLNCILNSRKQNFDIILQLGYTSSSIWSLFFPKKSILITNMDGLEWKRTKYSKKVQRFLKYAEKLGVKHSDHLISDSLGIKSYLNQTYQVDSEYIPYGATVFNSPNESALSTYNLLPYEYDMLLARLEPENSIEIILDGYVKSKVVRKFIVVANNKTSYGQYLVEKYKTNSSIHFLGSIYDIDVLNNLRHFSNLYFHGHTVGGTNPSLLEAMSSNALIVAHENEFNMAILDNDAYYFKKPDDVALVLQTTAKNKAEHHKIEANISKINSLYSWPRIIESYHAFFLKTLHSKKLSGTKKG